MIRTYLMSGPSRRMFPTVAYAPDDEGAGGSGGEDTKNTGSDAGAGGDAAADAANKAGGKSDDGADDGASDDKDKSAGKDKPGDDDKSDKGEDKADDKSKDKEDKSEGAPDEYADFTLPEGVEITDDSLNTFSTFAQDKGLTQKAAQELVDMHVKTLDEAATRQQEAWDNIKEEWKTETKALKSLQNDEGNSDEAVAASLAAVKKIGGQPLMDALDITGAGNHPTVVEAFFKISQVINEDGFVFGGGAGDTRSRAQKMFPNQK